VKHKRHAISKTRKVAKQSTEKARLSKRARIFIGVYMLAVAVVGVLFFFLI
jgi:cell division septal protein FtsQ